MSISSYYTIGFPHVIKGIPCQDYARVLKSDDQKVFIGALSDGCSGSIGDPSVGACLLVNEFLSVFRGESGEAIEEGFKEIPNLMENVLGAAINSACEAGYDREDFLASFLGVIKTNNLFKVFWYGDGVLVYNYKNGSTLIQFVSFPNNAPFYPVYRVFEDWEENFLSRSLRETCKYSLLFDAEGEDILRSVDVVSPFGQVLDLSQERDLVNVSLFSDGVQALADKTGNLASIKDVVRRLTSFPSHNGDFVRRRGTKCFTGRQEFFPQDDFSQVTLCLT